MTHLTMFKISEDVLVQWHIKATLSSATHMVSSSMSFSSVLLVAVELADVLLPSRGFTSSSVRQSTSRSPSDSS